MAEYGWSRHETWFEVDIIEIWGYLGAIRQRKKAEAGDKEEEGGIDPLILEYLDAIDTVKKEQRQNGRKN